MNWTFRSETYNRLDDWIDMKMDPQLDGKTAIITGATAGAGLAIAKMLSAKGVDIVIPGRCEQVLLAAAATIRGIVRIIVTDPATEEGAAILRREVPAADIFIDTSLRVSGQDRSVFPKADMPPLSVWQGTDANDFGLGGHYLQGMQARGWGRIVRISADDATSAAPSAIRYGLATITEHSKTGIPAIYGGRLSVNAVLAGRSHAQDRERLMHDGYGKTDAVVHEFGVPRGDATSWCLHSTIEAGQIVGLIASIVSPSTTGFDVAVPRREAGAAGHPIRVFRQTTDELNGSRLEFGADDASQTRQT